MISGKKAHRVWLEKKRRKCERCGGCFTRMAPVCLADSAKPGVYNMIVSRDGVQRVRVRGKYGKHTGYVEICEV